MTPEKTIYVKRAVVKERLPAS